MDSKIKLGLLRVFILAWMTSNSKAMDNDTFWQQREFILAQEEVTLLGQGVILTPEEHIANDNLMALKKAEMEAAFIDLNFPPMKNFLVAKDDIDASEVFKILKLMPKGSALHIHDSAAVSAEWIVSNLTYWDDLYMCYTPEDKFLMKFMETPDTTCEWQLVSEARASYPTPEEFDKLLLGELSLITDNPQEQYPDINAVWAAFQARFDARSGLISYKPAWEAYLYRLYLEFADDNVLYVEMRTGIKTLYELDGTEHTKEESIVIYKEISQRFLAEHSQDFFGDRVIFSKHKSWDVDEVWIDVEQAKTLKQNHPDYIVGFDLVGQEDINVPLKDIIDPLLSLSTGEVQLPVFYHAGETDWMGMGPDENIIDALLLNASRIGHGYAITKHPVAMQMARDMDVPLEVCPVSNQVLMLLADLRNHPGASLVSEGFPIVISSDDPGIFGAKGLSYDFYEAFMALGGAKADLRFLKQLAINSIKYSALDEVETDNLMNMWQKNWNEFITTLGGLSFKHN